MRAPRSRGGSASPQYQPANRKRKDKIRFEIKDFRDVSGSKGGHTRLLAPCSGRAHHIARNANDAPLLAEQIERLDSFLGETNDPFGREHIQRYVSSALQTQ